MRKGRRKSQSMKKCILKDDCVKTKDKDLSEKEDTGESTGEENEENELIPPDGGWGWMVAIGCFSITTLIPMVGPCFGILFSRYLLDLGTSSTTTAWIFNAQCFIWNTMGLITRPLTKEFGWRPIAVIGAFMTSVSMVLSAFAPNAEFLFFSFSILCGTGGGSVTCICFTILPHYFKRHRGVANALMMAGICLGQVIAPPLVQYLQDEYGFRWATLIIAALQLNACLGASLFHPVEWHAKKNKKSVDKDKDLELKETPVIDTEKLICNQNKANIKKSPSAKSLGVEAAERDVDWVEVIAQARLLRMNGGRNSSAISQLSLSSLAVSTVNIAGVGAGYTASEMDESSADEKKTEGKSLLRILARVANSTLADLKILKSPRALIIAIGAAFGINGYINFIMMVPFTMQVAGFTLKSSAWCISLSAISNLMLRMLVSSLSDWPRFNVKICYVLGFVIICISSAVFPFLTDLRWIFVVMIIWGCGVGMNMGLYNLVMISVMGLDNLAPVFGSSCFIVGTGFVLFGPLIGVIRDISGSYYVSIWVVSGMLLCSIFLWMFMPLAQKYDSRREDTKDTKQKQQSVA